MAKSTVENSECTASAQPEGAEQPTINHDEDSIAWRGELDAYESMRESLWDNPDMRDKFVAVRRKKVVAHDADEFELARRMFREYPGEVVLIKRLERRDRIMEMPSPERDG